MVKKYKFDWNATKTKIKAEETQKQSYGDDRFWKLDIDKETKKGSAILRYLPDTEGTPFKKYFSHWFTFVDSQGKKRYWTEKCATTIGGECPICEKNRDLFDSPYDSDKDVGRQRKRKIHYVANVLVVKDPAHPENDGKVKLFDFGPQVYDKYHLAMFGKEITDEDKKQAEEMGVEMDEVELFIPCDFEEGANFFYRSTLKDGQGKEKWNTYETSKFQPVTNIFPELSGKEWDQAVSDLMDQTHLLSEFVEPKSFPNSSSVASKLAVILGAVEVKSDSPDITERLNNGGKTDEDETSEDPELDTINVENPDEDDQAFIDGLGD